MYCVNKIDGPAKEKSFLFWKHTYFCITCRSFVHRDVRPSASISVRPCRLPECSKGFFLVRGTRRALYRPLWVFTKRSDQRVGGCPDVLLTSLGVQSVTTLGVYFRGAPRGQPTWVSTLKSTFSKSKRNKGSTVSFRPVDHWIVTFICMSMKPFCSVHWLAVMTRQSL